MKLISMIVAMAGNRAIGKDNDLLWHLPDDFKHFKAVTMGKPIVMGRKTYDSIGRPLPGRKNVVVTSDKTFSAEGVVVVRSIDDALAATRDDDDIMVIGGASFYEQMLPLANKLFVTWVHHHFEADAFFPDINLDEWRVIEQTDHRADDRHAYDYSFVTYERN